MTPDGQRAAIAKDNMTLAIMDVATGRQITPAFEGQRATVFAQFSPDGTMLLTKSDDTTFSVWDAATGERIVPAITHPPGLLGVQWAPDGEAIVTATRSGVFWHDLRPATASPEELRAEAELLSGSSLDPALDPALGIGNLDAASLWQRWQAVRARAAALEK